MMPIDKVKFFFKHSSIYGIGAIVGQAVGFLLLPLYTRYLTPADYGVATIIDLTMAAAGVTAASSIINAMARFYYDYEDENQRKRVVSTTFWMIGLFALIFSPVLYWGAPSLSILFFHSEDFLPHFRIAVLAFFFGIQVDCGMFYLRLRAQSVRFIIFSLSNLALLISFNIYFIAVRETGLIGIFYSMLLTRLLLFIVVAIPILIRVGVSFSGSLAGKILKFSWPLSLSDWFRLGVNESDKYLINFFFSPFETGIYTIANKIGTAVHALITVPFLQSFVPKRFEFMKAADAREVYARILNYYLLIIGSASLILSLFAKEILVIMATEKFYEAADYIFLFISAWIILGVRYHFETGILIEKKTKYFAYINGCTGVMTIGMNYFLIGRFGLWGALWALNISQVATTLSFYIISQRLYRIPYNYQFMMKLFGMVLFFWLVAKMVPMHNLALSIMVKIVLLGLYFSGLFLLGLIDREIMIPLKRAFVKACDYL